MSNRGTIRSIFLLAVTALLAFECKHPVSPPPPPNGPDTTSHVISWFLDTLGTSGFIKDVWGFSQTSAVGVGEIHTAQTDRYDSTGKWILPYNVARWNGLQWILETSTASINSFTQLDAVYAFGPKDIWVAGDTPEHWDGQKWTIYYYMNGYTGQFWIQRAWGTSSQNMFFVGDSGNIVHFNGYTWNNYPSGTKVNLQDIWGLDGSHIWATGRNVGDGHCVVLQFNGYVWTTIYDNANQPPATWFQFNTVWTDTPLSLDLAGGDRLRFFSLQTGTFGPKAETGQTYAAYVVRGVKASDLFVAAADGELAHYNGSSWYLYPELKALSTSSGFVEIRCIRPTVDFVVGGGDVFTGLNGFPFLIRGYR